MKKENPFTITFGKEPNRLISRYEDSDNIISTFQADNVVSQTFLIEGIRGSGKTVLMTSVAKKLAEDSRWIVINLNPAMDLLSGFATRLTDACDHKPELFNKEFNVSAAGFGVGVNADISSTDYVGMIDKAFKTLMKRKKRVLITIDEAIHDRNMKIFASQFQIMVRQDYPVFLIMTGLYESIHEIQNDPALTFLLRTPKIFMNPLSILQITRQYKEIFAIEEDEAVALAKITKGYAFAFQALGVCYFEYSDKGLDVVIEKLDELLDDFVYRKIWSALTEKEREIIIAISGDAERVSAVCARASVSNSTFSKYREALLAKGLIGTEKYGYVSLALPRFFEVARHYE